MIELLDTAIAKDVARVLNDIVIDARNAAGSNPGPDERVSAYMRWVPESVRRLQYLLPTAEIDRLISSRRYWTLLGLDPNYWRASWQMVDAEFDSRITALDHEISGLLAEVNIWEPAHAAILDTNLALASMGDLTRVDWTSTLRVRTDSFIILVLPMQVIDELDNLKDRGAAGVKQRARESLRLIEEWFEYPESPHRVQGVDLFAANPHAGVDLRLRLDPLRHERLSIADAEIVRASLSLKPFCASVTVITRDTNMLLRARGTGLNARRPVMSANEVSE